MTDVMHGQPKNKSRIELIDAARGFALIAMAVYHFAWDLEFFGYAAPGMTAVGGWRLFARSIASSFLFLVGFSLFLAHARAIRWRPFGKRMLQVGAAAAAITLVTYFATPDAFIFFGILHHIALASLLGLLFLRLPAVVVAAAALFVIALPALWRHDMFNGTALAWTGLAAVNPRSNDFVPIFPWFAAVLLGIAAAKVAKATGWTERAAGRPLPSWTRPLQLAGQHSLAFYLLHQPVLVGLIFLASLVVPPQVEEPRAAFARACEAQCAQTRDAAFCTSYCGCVVSQIDSDPRAQSIYDGSAGDDATGWLGDIATQCSMTTDLEWPGEAQ